jgi:hypothetical protein
MAWDLVKHKDNFTLPLPCRNENLLQWRNESIYSESNLFTYVEKILTGSQCFHNTSHQHMYLYDLVDQYKWLRSKVKFVMKTYWGCRYTSSHSWLDGGEWSASRPGRLTPGVSPVPTGTHWAGSLMGPRAGLDAVAKRKKSRHFKHMEEALPRHRNDLGTVIERHFVNLINLTVACCWQLF